MSAMTRLLILVALLVVGVPVGTGLYARSDGSLTQAVAQANTCVGATDALGPAIDTSFVGLTCGSSSGHESYRQAIWSAPVRGARGRGTLSYAADWDGHSWTVVSARLEVGDRTVPVVPCDAATARAAPRPDMDPPPMSRDARSCEVGDVRACNRAGVEAASATPPDLVRAERYYRRACDGDLAVGCGNVASLLERDRKDVSAALPFYQRGCQLGARFACERLDRQTRAPSSARTRPVQTAKHRARRLLGTSVLAPLEAACERGSAPSCADAGDRFESRGDVETALQRWTTACDLRDARGCGQIGRHYVARGHADVARGYLEMGCRLGDDDSCGHLTAIVGRRRR